MYQRDCGYTSFVGRDEYPCQSSIPFWSLLLLRGAFFWMPPSAVKYQIGLLHCGPVSGAYHDLFAARSLVLKARYLRAMEVGEQCVRLIVTSVVASQDA